ncbi:hypothetical protein [Aminicella lysinilytica]|uniref:Uncharacterized protein n=1 Tax=Aminicella lysinilytica TaxID=433323 RepID=A0A4R6QBA3_9FIRM|nr:hypothetical protein [Aminicella lysinilytica]TDP59083.1 hypothetical protein EV211_10413 [Aminicella lysinilytica]
MDRYDGKWKASFKHYAADDAAAYKRKLERGEVTPNHVSKEEVKHDQKTVMKICVWALVIVVIAGSVYIWMRNH